MFIASIAVPAISLRQSKRIHATAVAFAYYAGAVWLAIPAAKAFFGPHAGLADGIAIWLCGAALLSTPYAILWTPTRRFIALRTAGAVLMSVPPPLGIIGVASPLTAAGLLFPGTAWFGLAATLATIAWISIHPIPSAAIVVATALLCNALYPGTPKPPADWEAVNTNFGDVGRRADAELKAAEFIQQRARCSRARVIIFPETVVPRWTEATELFWRPALAALARRGTTVLSGTTFDISGQAGYENGVVLRGAQKGRFLQHVPVAIGMWNPFTAASVPLHLFAPSTIHIGHQRAAILICYEQLLTWPVLKAGTSDAKILIGIANCCWTSTRVCSAQEHTVRLWSRLFNLPAITATNL
jgi:hypothetical protein